MLEVRIKKNMGEFTLDVSFRADSGVTALLGGSGSGKSMTLRAIAGIVTPDEGYIAVDDTVFFDSEKKINLTPQERKVGLLFQNYALFPTMTVLENIMAGIRTGSRAQKRAAAMDALERFRLDGLGDRLPSQISGGQQQRAALARILVGSPRLLMLDEPFSALDSHLRSEMEREVLGIIRDFGGTTLLVSHSRDEVFRMSDRIAVYDNGHIDAIGEKHALFSDPGTYRAAMLTGCKNFSTVSDLRSENGMTRFQAEDWGLELQLSGEKSGSMLGIRAHYLHEADEPGPNRFLMDVTEVIEDPFEYVVLLRRSGHTDGTIQWMIDKANWRKPPEGQLLIEFPEEALMLLRK